MPQSYLCSPRARAALWAAALLLAVLNPLLCLTHCALIGSGAAPRLLGQAYVCHPAGAGVEPAGAASAGAASAAFSQPQVLYAAALPDGIVCGVPSAVGALLQPLACAYRSWHPPCPKLPPRIGMRRIGSCRMTSYL